MLPTKSFSVLFEEKLRWPLRNKEGCERCQADVVHGFCSVRPANSFPGDTPNCRAHLGLACQKDKKLTSRVQ